MQNLSKTFSSWEYLWRKQNIIYWAFGWSALSLFIFVFFSGPPQGIERPFWYRLVSSYILQNVPLFVAGCLCLRNGLSRRMPSGSKVWLLMGVALISYLIGNVFFTSWELVWHLNSTGCLGDPFFCIFYILLCSAMIMAIASKRVKLKIYQWLIVIGISLYAATIVVWILQPPPTSPTSTLPTASQTQTSSQLNSSAASIAPTVTKPERESTPDAPGWVMFFDGMFKPYGQMLNGFYVWSDVLLFALATVMILAFWGGRLSNAWQVNAQAIICFYIADMWFAYAGNQIPNYQAGFMLEVFWCLGAVQFAVAAGLEFDHMLARKKAQEVSIIDN